MNWRIDQFLFQKEKPFWKKVVLFPFYLLSFPYRGVVIGRVFLYSTGIRKPKSLPFPVISVGNITAGGTGKTPLVMEIARVLREKGIPVAILSRGYKGKKTQGRLVSDGNTLPRPEEVGDEPFMMAKILKEVPIFVGKDRFTSAQMAIKRFKVRGFILDDGFQHLQLHRDLDILLVDSKIGFGDNHLLPRGILREPLTHLRRAHLLLLTKVEGLKDCQSIESEIRKIHPQAPVFHSHYEPVGLISPSDEWEGIEALKGKKVLILSGIADPESFQSLVRKCQVEVVREITFPDHHSYTLRDIEFLRSCAEGVECIVTTEKDMVKLNSWSLRDLPLRALRIKIKIWEEEEFFKRVMEIF